MFEAGWVHASDRSRGVSTGKSPISSPSQLALRLNAAYFTTGCKCGGGKALIPLSTGRTLDMMSHFGQ
ncbi:hypothetical protein C0Q70_04126 [Pomacea canaliculata]|uniref:Uncharacterized protein n=1 Tax=Pomacea canaliculata TaxID=400727 RepID=A0A2T7PUN5_POMCA|nr:hypothetical protein C0Q70_04126 [Pomacea canaliculata]